MLGVFCPLLHKVFCLHQQRSEKHRQPVVKMRLHAKIRLIITKSLFFTHTKQIFFQKHTCSVRSGPMSYHTVVQNRYIKVAIRVFQVFQKEERDEVCAFHRIFSEELDAFQVMFGGPSHRHPRRGVYRWPCQHLNSFSCYRCSPRQCFGEESEI